MSEDEIYTTRLDLHEMERELVKAQQVELFFQGELVSLSVKDLPFQLGRDQSSCDLVVSGDTISRQHCTVEIRDRQIGLVDNSTNGTYVKVGRSDDVFVHNEFHPLVGQGAIRLGRRIDMDDSDLIYYKVIKIKR